MRRLVMPERTDLARIAAEHGFAFHRIDGERYWDERACYVYTLRQIEDDIEQATVELHQMALALVDEVVRSESLMQRLAIPPECRDWIRDAWVAEAPHLYGRMDLAYDGHGQAKLYELNYDTPTALYEAAYFQWLWLEQQREEGALPDAADQYNRIQEALCERFAALAQAGRIAPRMHFASVRGSAEDLGTVEYLRDCAQQAGLDTAWLALEDIGVTADGEFTDLDDGVIDTLFKLYPLEHMMGDAFAPALRAGRMQLIEPPWKAVLSNKGILPLLWQRHPGHPNLLPARFADARSATAPGWVRKPLLSREGANIEAVTRAGERHETPGPYAAGDAIVQAWHPLPGFDGNYPVLGSWVVGDLPCGLGIREDAGPITRDTSRFVPHAILD